MTTYANVGHILLKRGNTTQSTAYTGPVGELTFDTGLNTVRAHNGSTAGGILLATNGQSLAANANVGAFQTYANLTFGTQANAATQAVELNSLRANITAANSAITSLTSNAAIQATLLDTLTGNAVTQSQVLDTLTSNAATQANTLSTLLGNAVAQQTSLIDLLANAVTQSQQIANAAGTYGNANVKSYFDSFDGNIIPAANVTYSLGSSTRQWRDLWVSNNTIYIGNTPIRVDGGTLLVNGAPVGGSYSNANVAAYLPTYTGNIAGNIVKNGYTWTFGTDGNLTVPASGTITAPINQEFQLQTRDTNSVLRNEINLDPNNGTYMSVWSDGTASFSFNDWDTGSWNNESGLGAARFTDAQALQNFWTTGIGSLGLPIEASINGGARTPNVFYDGNNGEQYGVTLGLDAVPPGGQGTTVPITSLVFYYQTQSKINIDLDGGEILLDAQSMDLDLRTTNNLDLRAGENLNLRGLGQYPVRIYTDDSTHMWEFDTSGSLTLPSQGKIYGIGAPNDRLGYMSWTGNTSGDGQGWNTMRLVPDLQGLEDVDTYIILDPAYDGQTGNIHIRAGGTRDNSLANLYLGGANSHVKIGSGSNPPVTVKANSHSWTFSNTGTTTFPTGVTLSNARGANTVNFLTAVDKSFQIETQTNATSKLWNFTTDGNLTLPQNANINFANGVSILAGITGTYGNTQVAAYLPTYTGNIAGNIVKNGNVWTFGTNGTTTFPTNISIDYSGNNVQFPRIIADSGKAFSVQAQGNIGSAALSWTVDPDAAGQYAAVAVTKGGGDNLAKVLLSAQSDSGDAATAKTWVFNQTGTTRFPDGTILAPAGQNITMQSDQYSQLYWQNANVTVAPDMAINSNFYVAQNNATLDIVYRDGSSTQQQKSWLWSVDGSLTLPAGGVIAEGGGISGAIRLTPAGGANSNQALVIYPTAGAPEGDHIHLTAGGGSTELYLGNDFHYVKLVDGGNIELRAATANLSAQAAWTFDTTGNVDTIQALGIKVPNGVPSDVAVINSTTGSWEANPRSNLATTGGSGSGLTVNVTETGGYASTIAIATAGTGYTNGDLITVTSGTSNATFTIVIGGRNTWQFGTDGALTFPDATVQSTAWTGILPSPTYSGSDAIGNVPPSPLNLNNTGTSGQLKTQLTLINTAGGGGTGSAIDFFTYTDVGSGFPGARIQSIDDSNYSADLSIILKEPGSGDNTDGATWAFGANANLTLPETGYLRVGSGIVAGFASSPAPIISGFSSISAENFRFQGNGVNILSNLYANAATQATSINTISNTLTSSNVGIGLNAGATSQGDSAVAIGEGAGTLNQGIYSVAIGNDAGTDNQGDRSVAVGTGAGRTNQGNYAVAIGRNAGYTNQGNNSIIINATTGTLNQITANTFTVAPVRNDVSNVAQVLFYNTTNKEITYGNTINIAGNINAAQYNFANGVNILSTVGAGAYGNTQVASYLLNFDGDIEFTSSTARIGNVDVITVMDSIRSPAYQFSNGASILSGVVSKTTGTWNVTTGTNTYSFTVPASGTYQLWVDCNIPNGILTWNATATVTNTNVPVVGAQYAWVYNGGGTPIDFTSIPNQFTGTANTIVRSNVAPSSTTNRFDFGINNASGGNVTVRYGWIQIS
jgi:hypothetical protein